MSDLNVVALTGRLTRDPELRSPKAGTAVATLRLATKRRKGANGEDRGAAFMDVEVWENFARSCCRSLREGARVGVEGSLDHKEWIKDGIPRQANFVVARWVRFLDPPAAADGAPGEGDTSS